MKKGVTLIMLVIIIIILTTLLTVVVINGNNIFNDTKKVKLQTEISQIEILVDNYIMRNSGNNFEKVELDISTYTEAEKKQFEGEKIVDNKIELYVVDLYKIDVQEANYGTGTKGTSDRYLYSETTKKIYYEQGIKMEGIIYHRVDTQEET